MSNHSRTHNSARNVTFALIQRLVTIVLTFVSRQIFLQVLTVEYLGINTLFADILGLLSLVDIGMTTAMAYSFYKPIADKDEHKLAALIHFYAKVYNIIAAVIAVIGLGLIPFIGQIVHLESYIPNLEIYYLLALANLILSYLFIYKTALISADQHKRIIIKYRTIASIITITLQVIILLTTGSFMLFCTVPLLTTLATNLFISHKATTAYPFIKQKRFLGQNDKRVVFTNIKSTLVHRVANVIIIGTDTLFISIFSGAGVVGLYANYSLAVSNMTQFAYVIFNSMSASVGNLVATESSEKQANVFKAMQAVCFWLSGFFCFALFFLLDDFVYLWLGSEFVFDVTMKIAILASLYLSVTLFPVVAFREATGMFNRTKYVVAAAAVIKIALAILMGKAYGPVGIIMATVISKLTTYAWYEPKILFRDFLNSSAVGYFLGNLANLMLLVGCIVAVYFFVPLQEVSGWMHWIVRGFLVTITINVIYFLRYFWTSEFRIIINKLKRLKMK